MEDICVTELVLALGHGGKTTPAANSKRHNKLESLSSDSLEAPSLTLGRQYSSSSSHSTLSSHSNVKREGDDAADAGGGGGGEDVVDRRSSRTNDNQEDGSNGGRSKKLRLSKEQSALLEDTFKEQTTLNPKQKTALAKQLNLRPRQVEVWFQNRRARTKLKQTEVDCQLLRKYCDMLAEDNRRLRMEVQELKALNRAPTSLYVHQFPAAAAAAAATAKTTVAICASCRKTAADAHGGRSEAAA